MPGGNERWEPAQEASETENLRELQDAGSCMQDASWRWGSRRTGLTTTCDAVGAQICKQLMQELATCTARKARCLWVLGGSQMVKMEGCTLAGHCGRVLKGHKARGIPNMLPQHLPACGGATGRGMRSC